MGQHLTTVENIDRSQGVIYPYILDDLRNVGNGWNHVASPMAIVVDLRFWDVASWYLYYGAGTVKVIAITTHDLLRVSRFYSRTAGN